MLKMQLGMKEPILEKQIDWAAKRLLEVHKIDIKNTPFLISEDDTLTYRYIANKKKSKFMALMRFKI